MKVAISGCIFLLFAFGCRKTDNTPGNQNATEIFPNKVGDTWVYRVNDTTVNRSSPDSPSVQYNLVVSVVDSIQLPGGIKANVWVYTYPGGSDTAYVFQSGDTVHFIGYVDINLRVGFTYARQYILPLHLQSAWAYTEPSFSNIGVDSQANIVVGQNHFDNAFHIFGYAGMPDAGFTIDEWLENNVGVVKRHFDPSGMLIDPRHVTAWSLISYHLK
jgi:hypothetical protein